MSFHKVPVLIVFLILLLALVVPVSAEWVEINSSSPAIGAYQTALSYNNSIISIAGYDADWNDIGSWISTDGGYIWEEKADGDTPGWEYRTYPASTRLNNGDILLYGGSKPPAKYDDIWKSNNNGETWVEINSSVTGHGRINVGLVTLKNNDVVLFGGCNGTEAYNDTWKSSDGGYTWDKINESAGWESRCTFGVVDDNDEIFVIAGNNAEWYNDVWKSSDHGYTWTELNTSTGFPVRTDFGITTIYDTIFIFGGVTHPSMELNDTWKSSDGGYTWEQIDNATWSPRDSLVSVVVSNNKVIVLGGQNLAGDPLSDVWMWETGMEPPVVIPVASFTTNVTSGTVPLAVGFTDTSTNTPTSWNWSFGDGNWSNGTSSAVSYLYEYPGTYNAFLIASNGGGSSTSATTAITVSSGTVPRCEDQTGNITLSLFFNSTTSLGWTWNDPVNITKIAEDGLYVLTFDNSSDYFIGTGYSPESWHKLKIYNETDFGQLNCTTDAVPIIPTSIPIMPSTESTAGSINLIQYWWIVAGVLGIIILFKRG